MLSTLPLSKFWLVLMIRVFRPRMRYLYISFGNIGRVGEKARTLVMMSLMSYLKYSVAERPVAVSKAA
ncbi:hypothetical protein D3C84_1228960 [compost metagenome]